MDPGRYPRPSAAATRLGCLSALVALSFGCSPAERPSPGERASSAGAARFADVTEAWGLPAGAPGYPDGTYYLPELMGAGVALFDADGDGDLDALQARFPPPGRAGSPASNRFYRQDPGGRFVDASASSGLGDPGHGQALAVGDVNGDGAYDVFVANYGADALYVNDGHGGFREQGGPFGDPSWSSSATFCDYDGDGDLDLYVARYLRYRFQERCALGGTGEDYCSPTSFPGEADGLFRNDGAAGFVDVSRASGVAGRVDPSRAKGLGVVCLDLTNDGRPDFFVANDGEMNHLWANRGDGTFEEQAIMRGLAVNGRGAPEASMGITVGDADGDGALDLFVTHLAQETNTLYRALGGGLYRDRSIESGLSAHDLAWTGFGCGFLDFDLDGDADVVVVNGRIHRGDELPGATLGAFWNRYAEPDLLFENRGDGTFVEIGLAAGALPRALTVSRGLALGDVDGDGDDDLLVSSVDGGLRLLRNDAPAPGRHWLAVRPVTAAGDAVGAQVVVRAGERFASGVLLPGQSYQSAREPRVRLGLGEAERIEAIDVRWPDGALERFPGGPTDREYILRRGTGRTP
jgi:hypothetical protein